MPGAMWHPLTNLKLQNYWLLDGIYQTKQQWADAIIPMCHATILISFLGLFMWLSPPPPHGTKLFPNSVASRCIVCHNSQSVCVCVGESCSNQTHLKGICWGKADIMLYLFVWALWVSQVDGSFQSQACLWRNNAVGYYLPLEFSPQRQPGFYGEHLGSPQRMLSGPVFRRHLCSRLVVCINHVNSINLMHNLCVLGSMEGLIRMVSFKCCKEQSQKAKLCK